VAHRDLKPENLILGEDGKVKLIDFGMADFFTANEKQDSIVGTPYYIAPEVLTDNHDKRCDLWSVGVLAYVLLAGYPPFMGESDAEIFSKIKSCDWDFCGEVWDEVSEEAHDFIESLLSK